MQTDHAIPLPSTTSTSSHHSSRLHICDQSLPDTTKQQCEAIPTARLWNDNKTKNDDNANADENTDTTEKQHEH